MTIDQREVDFVIGASNALLRTITTPPTEIAFTLSLEPGDDGTVYLDTMRKIAKTHKVKLLCDYDPDEAKIDVYIKEFIVDESNSTDTDD